jgi:hypothetical protein
MVNWDRRHEKSVIRLANMAQGYNILHYRNGVFYKYIDILLGMIIGIITTVSGVILSYCSSSNYCLGKGNDLVMISMLFSSAVVNFIQQYLSLAKQGAFHAEYAKKYQLLYNQVVSHIVLHRRHRQDAEDYNIALTDNINTLVEKAPEINPFISWMYRSLLDEFKIRLPQLDELEEIDIGDIADASIKYGKNGKDIVDWKDSVYVTNEREGNGEKADYSIEMENL